MSSNISLPCHLDLGEVVSAGGAECLFVVEPVKYDTAAQRCAAEYENGVVCPATIYRSDSSPFGDSRDWQETCGGYQYAWTDEPCELQVQVYPSGEVSVVDRGSYMDHLEKDSGSKFTVAWDAAPLGETRGYPFHGTNCTAGCRVFSEGGGSCLCDATVQDTPYISNSISGQLPTEDVLRTELKIGASPPDQFESAYTLCTTALCTSRQGIRVYTRGTESATPAALDIDTIFEFTEVSFTTRPSTRKPAKFLLNRISTVHVGRTKEYHLLNPHLSLIHI